jgi:hypothetical protein
MRRRTCFGDILLSIVELSADMSPATFVKKV